MKRKRKKEKQGEKSSSGGIFDKKAVWFCEIWTPPITIFGKITKLTALLSKSYEISLKKQSKNKKFEKSEKV